MAATTAALRSLIEQLRQYSPSNCARGHVFTQGGLPQSEDPPWKGSAAVLVCLFEGEAGDIRVLLTKRASKLSTHSGEVALPGGKMEEGDADVVVTALREAKEEIGLDPALLTVATVLEPFTSRDVNRRSEERGRGGVKFSIQFFDYEKEKKIFVIWGLTAAILIRAASVVYKRPPAFTDYVKFNASSKI